MKVKKESSDRFIQNLQCTDNYSTLKRIGKQNRIYTKRIKAVDIVLSFSRIVIDFSSNNKRFMDNIIEYDL